MSKPKPKPNRFQPGHRHSTLHGLRASGLPGGCRYLEQQLTAFRGLLRDELGPTPSVYQQALAQSATRHETRALLASRWLRLHEKDLSHNDRLAFLKHVGDATDARDKCLQRMGLDKDNEGNVFDALYSRGDPHELRQ